MLEAVGSCRRLLALISFYAQRQISLSMKQPMAYFCRGGVYPRPSGIINPLLRAGIKRAPACKDCLRHSVNEQLCVRNSVAKYSLDL